MDKVRTERSFVVYGALAANLGIGLAKFVTASLSGSSVMFSEAIHSVADSGNELLLLWGIRRSRRPPDGEHPYGHGKELYFWSLIVAIVLFSLGGGMSIYQGISHIRRPEPLGHLTYNLVVLGVALMFESSSLLIGVRQLRKDYPDRSLWDALRASKDPSVFMVVGEDAAAIVGLCIAFAGVVAANLTKISALDGIASIVVGALLCGVSVMLAWETRGLLIGESAGVALTESIERLAKSDAAVHRTGHALTMHLGPREVLLNLELEFCSDLSMQQLRIAVKRIEDNLREAHPEITRIFLEASALGAENGK